MFDIVIEEIPRYKKIKEKPKLSLYDALNESYNYNPDNNPFRTQGFKRDDLLSDHEVQVFHRPERKKLFITTKGTWVGQQRVTTVYEKLNMIYYFVWIQTTYLCLNPCLNCANIFKFKRQISLHFKNYGISMSQLIQLIQSGDTDQKLHWQIFWPTIEILAVVGIIYSRKKVG
jgi:hypothetical protein